MTGRVIVEAPQADADADGDGRPDSAAGGRRHADADADADATATPRQTALAVRLAAGQRGTRVRGAVDVAQAGSRLEVTVLRGPRRVGALGQDARRRHGDVLRAAQRQGAAGAAQPRPPRRDSVTVALTPPGGRRSHATSGCDCAVSL